MKSTIPRDINRGIFDKIIHDKHTQYYLGNLMYILTNMIYRCNRDTK